MELQNKVALITGGAVRVGQAITLALAQAGCDVFIHYGKSAAAAVETKNAVAKLGRRAVSYSADLSDSRAVHKVMKMAVEAYGQIDILINNAAVNPPGDRFETLDEKKWDLIQSVNLKAPFLLCQDFARHVGPERPAKIININDARVPRTGLNFFGYRLAKRSLWELNNILALELAPNITVNQVALGTVLPPSGKSQREWDKMAAHRVPLQQAGTLPVVAENVLHLLTQDFLTGVTIEVDGGEFL